jgi:hypothetical protein
MKSPPVQYSDEQARAMVEAFIQEAPSPAAEPAARGSRNGAHEKV